MKRPTVRRARQSADDSLSTYLHEIAAYPLLTREQEVELARRGRAGDAEAIEQLVCSNLRFVVSVAKKYRHQGVSLADLIDEGNVGLIRAAQKFDERRETKFISYAVWWIRQAIFQALAEQSHIIRMPLSRAARLHRIGRHASALLQELGRDPTRQEISADMDISEREIANTMEIAPGYLSLDAPLGTSEDARLFDYVPDDLSPAPDDQLADAARETVIENALTRLKGREGIVLRLYFGFDGNEAKTLEEIGTILGVTRERVRQIKERALSRLRKTQSRVLSSLLG
ncbi:MAG: RNA polymerase sigma factor RpoD/SigA [Gemmatimonas sp.]